MSRNILSPISGRLPMATDYVVRKYRGDIITGEYKAKNLLLNGFFDALLDISTPTHINGVVFGAGTAMPSETDTALQSYLGGGNSFQAQGVIRNSTVSPLSVTNWVTIRCAEGAVVGNVSELGIYRSSSSAPVAPSSGVALATRARIVDGAGSPTTITVSSDEFLEVTFYWTVYLMDGVTGTLTINLLGTPTDFDYEIRPISMQNTDLVANFHGYTLPSNNPTRELTMGFYTGTSSSVFISGVTGETSFGDPSSSANPPGQTNASNKFTTITPGPYTPGSKQRTFTLRLPLNNGNIASPGIRSFNLQTGGPAAIFDSLWFMHQVLLDGPFQKMAGQIFDLPIQVTLGNA